MKNPTTLQETANKGMGASSQEILTYLDDTSTQRAMLPGMTPLAPVAYASGREVRTHTLEDILARPALLQTVTWQSLDVNNTRIATFTFPDVLLQKAIVASKLANFTFMRADICVRIIANTTPFQAGKLLAYFSPLGEVVGNRGTANDYLTAKTAFPHAILDASVGNVIELRIPYVNPYNHYNLTNSINEMGTMYLDIMNQLRSGVAGSAPVSIFAWFENLDISVPTAARLVVPTMKAQINTEEEDKSKTGIITDITTKFAAFSSAAEGLPYIGDAFAPLTWMSKIAAHTASAVGLSKPASVSAPCKYTNLPAVAYTHGEGIDEGTILATMPSNSIQGRVDVFGTDVDEMDISYLTSRSVLRRTFEWGVADEDDLLRFPVHPMDMHFDSQTVASVAYPYFESTMVGYVASAFDLWRGSMKYKIQVAKTAYHSGRLRISYIPGGNIFLDEYDYDHGYSWILDLRTSNEIEFEVPFTSPVPWLATEMASDENKARTHGGILAISVLNPLVAPSTVSSNVEINVWIAGGSDFELARPTMNKWLPVRLAPVMQAQVNEDDQTKGFNDFGDAAAMFGMGKMSMVEAAALCVGEKVLNLRTLCKRSNVKYAGNIIEPNVQINIPASSLGVITQIDQQPSGQLMVPVEYFSYLYRFFRGGFNFKILTRSASFIYTQGGIRVVNAENAQIRSTSVLRKIPTFSATTQQLDPTDFVPYDCGAFTHTTQTYLNFAHEIKAPYFTNTQMQPIYGPDFPVASGTNFDLPALNNNEVLIAYESGSVIVPNDGARRARVEVLKAASDDFQFGWVVGPPRIAPYTGVTQDSWVAL